MKGLYLIMILMAVIVVALFVPVNVFDKTLANYLLAGLIFVEISVFVVGKYLESPSLKIREINKLQFNEYMYYRVVVENQGRMGATDCEAKVTLHGVDPGNDVMVIPNQATVMTKGTGVSFHDMLVCSSELRNPSKASIAVKAESLFDFMRAVKPKTVQDAKFHIELPTESGWSPTRVALRPKDYKGEIVVQSMNVKPAKRPFNIKYRGGEDLEVTLA